MRPIGSSEAAFVDGGSKVGLTAAVVKAIITKGKATTAKEAEADAAKYAQQPSALPYTGKRQTVFE